MIPLTYFEFGTLAALNSSKADWISGFLRLEWGQTGCAMVDCDLALIASIDLDHQARLGTREAIGESRSLDAAAARSSQIPILPGQ